MLRIAILLLVFAGSLPVGCSYAGSPDAGSPDAGSPDPATPEIETLNESESAFTLGSSRISVEIRDRVLRGKKDMLLEWVVYSADTVSGITAVSRSTRYTSRCRLPMAMRSALARPLAENHRLFASSSVSR